MGFLSKLFKGIGKLLKAVFKFIGKIFSALFGGSKSPNKDDSKTNEELMSTTAQPARASPVLYGCGRVAGNRVYQNISSATDTKLITVLSFGVGQISEISAVRMDNNKICDVLASNVGQIQAINNKYNAELQTYVTTTPEGWKYISNPNAIANINARREAEINTLNSSSSIVQCNKWVRIEGRLGSTTQPAMSLATSNSAELTANSTGAGHVLLAVEQLKDQGTSDYQNAQADIKIDYVGRTILDLRSMTLVAGCDNGPSVLWDYMTSSLYGCGYTANEVDFSSFVKAANQVIVGFNGSVDNGKTQKSVIEAITNSFGGELALVNGKITLVLDYSTTDYVYLNDEVLVGELSHESDVITNKFNGVDVNWTNPASDYTTQTLRYPPNFDQDQQIAAEGENIKKFDLPYSTSKTDVDRMSSYYLNQRLIDETVTFQAIGFGTHVEVGNVVALSSVHKDWSNKLFRVVRVDKKLTQGAINQVQIQAKEFIPEVYSTVYTGAIIPDTPSGIFSNSSVVSNVRIQMMPAEMGSCVRLRWDYVGNFISGKFMVAYKPSTSSDWIVADDGVLGNMCDIYNLVPAASYDFRVCNVNKLGFQGPWVTVSGFRTADVISMPVVTNLRLVNRVSEAEPTYANSRDFVIAWDDVRNSSIIVDQYAGDASGAITASKLIRTYRVEVYEGARFKKSYDTTDPQFTYTFDRNAADGLSRNNTFKVRVVGHNNQIGNSVDITCKNPQCGGVSGMEDKCVAGTVFLKWAAPVEADYVGVLIYASKTPNVAISSENLKARSYITNSFSIDFSSFGGADAFIKYGAYDEFGEDEIVWKEQAVSTKGWVEESQVSQALKDKINAPITPDRLPVIPADKIGQATIDQISSKVSSPDVVYDSSTEIVVTTVDYDLRFDCTAGGPADLLLNYECPPGVLATVKRICPDVSGSDIQWIQTGPDQKMSVAIGHVIKTGNVVKFNLIGCSPTNPFKIKRVTVRASSIEAGFHATEAVRTQLTNALADETSARVDAMDRMQATVDGVSSSLNTEIKRVESSLTNSLATTQSQLSSSIKTANDNITATNNTLNQTRVDLTNAMSTQKTQLEASIASTNQSAKLELLNSVDAKLGSTFVLKTDVNGKYAGFGLINGGTTGSAFRIQADKFIVDSGSSAVIPFAVEGANTYINSAMIKNATIVNAHIADGSITNAKIADATIDNAKIGNVIMSSNYNWNNGDIQGWYLAKNYNNSGGLFVCRNAILHSVDSRLGTFNSATINSATINDAAINRGSIQDAWINRGSINNLQANAVTINGNCVINGELIVNGVRNLNNTYIAGVDGAVQNHDFSVWIPRAARITITAQASLGFNTLDPYNPVAKNPYGCQIYINGNGRGFDPDGSGCLEIVPWGANTWQTKPLFKSVVSVSHSVDVYGSGNITISLRSQGNYRPWSHGLITVTYNFL